MKTVGVLAVQGAFERHAVVLRELGHRVVLVRDAEALVGLDGLVLPGGESTVQLQLLARLGLEGPLHALISSGRPVLATCAGLILLARVVSHPAQHSLGLVDVELTRNGWGRQVDSFEAVSDEPEPLPLVFIRAPRITAVGERAQVLARYQGEPVLVRDRAIVGATFHPELTSDRSIHARVFGS